MPVEAMFAPATRARAHLGRRQMAVRPGLRVRGIAIDRHHAGNRAGDDGKVDPPANRAEPALEFLERRPTC